MSKNNVNKIIRALIVSDFFLFFSIGLLAPIFAVFILNNIANKIEVIGYAVAAYWAARVISVVPFSRLMDKMTGEMDEYFFMILGTMIVSSIADHQRLSQFPGCTGLAHTLYSSC